MLKPGALLCASALALSVGLAHAATEIPARLKSVDKITLCGGMDSPPIGFYDSNQKLQGVVVDFGNEIAKRLGGKKVEWKVIPFSGLIPALVASQCDMLADQLFDKPARREVIDMVDYMYSSQSVVVAKGNPKGIHTLDDLSGKKVAVLNGSTIRSLLEDQNKTLVAAGKAPMTIVVFNTDTDAFQSLRIQQSDAYGTTVETAGYYQSLAPNLFETGVPAFARILTGFGFRKGDNAFSGAVEQIIKDMQADGSYLKLLEKWHIAGDRLDAGQSS
ncbi:MULTISPECIES: ABC transporter substrate-binding protein [Dickeya]|uniref:ABC transporter substrate-binding protein n=1 Tax=Dickeya TaxID=204037 RepID=UPI0020975F3D|nr:ABC transporter substrate-binding protein [Dickeya oryzae]MCO7254585.1 ABC transporter substrate-binding protein [Dickeya oryzae]UUE09586.1 ABC transporter substrate-binding protein [Dickeya zeae]